MLHPSDTLLNPVKSVSKANPDPAPVNIHVGYRPHESNADWPDISQKTTDVSNVFIRNLVAGTVSTHLTNDADRHPI
jgi:hypothetical protein